MGSRSGPPRSWSRLSPGAAFPARAKAWVRSSRLHGWAQSRERTEDVTDAVGASCRRPWALPAGQRRAAISTFRGAEAVPAPDPAGMGDMDPGHVTDALLVVGPGCSPAWAEPVGGGAAGRVARLDARAGSGE